VTRRPYGRSLVTAFPAGGETLTSGTETTLAATATNPVIVTISDSDQVIDPGVENHTIQFLTGSSAGALVLHANSVDQVLGFDPMTDILDAGALLSGANVNLNGDIAALRNYLTIVDQGWTHCFVSISPGRAAGARSSCCKRL
jgi:hypothetical protein